MNKIHLKITPYLKALLARPKIPSKIDNINSKMERSRSVEQLPRFEIFLQPRQLYSSKSFIAMFRQLSLFEDCNMCVLVGLVLFLLTIVMSIVYLVTSWVLIRDEVDAHLQKIVNVCEKPTMTDLKPKEEGKKRSILKCSSGE